MIFDKVENIDRYDLGLSFLKTSPGNLLFKSGKFEVSNFPGFGIGLEYETKEETECLWEAHRKYLDIHLILKGNEFVDISDINSMNISEPYVDDYELFVGEKQQQIRLKPGYFLVLFPDEVHKTSIKIEHSEKVQKIVFKKIIDE